MSWPLYPHGKSRRCPLSRRIRGSQRRSGHFREGKILAALGNVTRSRHSGDTILCHIFQLKETQYFAGINYFYFLCDFQNKISVSSLLLHRASCRFTNHYTTNKFTNCMSFILNHFFKTLLLLLHVSIAYRSSLSGSTYSS